MKYTLSRRSILKQSLSLAAISVAGVKLLSAPAIAKTLTGTGELIVYDGGGTWGAAQKTAFFDPFEEETGIRLIRNPRSEMAAIRASVQAGIPRYDITVIAGGDVPSFVADDLLLPIDYSFFEKEDLAGFDTVSTQKFACPHIIYALIGAYSTEEFPNGGPDNWSDFWDTKKFPGLRTLGTGVQQAGVGTFEAALLADGVDPSKLYPLDWDRAFKSLDRIKPDVLKWWESGAETGQLLVDKQVVGGSAWNGRISSAIDEGVKLSFMWNQGLLQTDYWVALKGSKNQENAMKFLAFAGRADRQAEFVKHILYSPPNSRAFSTIAPDLVTKLPTQPSLKGKLIPQDYDFWGQSTDGVPNVRYAVSQWEAWISGTR
ncbi:ABC transporter substrate-binding protein [Rhizobium laguerreae]|uniref:ABC transporter substrate-binding protein n=1 Tax=Rhizobium laguerreae TaxID=1076926 RepID=UPI001C9246C9|nr:ABC transporter substrate-binding protein [Rhizobium laguerreae]